jgi:hypothetical protein
MNVEIGAEAVLFPEKEYINGIAVAVLLLRHSASFPAPPCSTSAPAFSSTAALSCSGTMKTLSTKS